MDYVWIGLGAAIGANGRYVAGQVIARQAGSGFPYGTLAINASGSLVIGILMTILTERLIAGTSVRLFLVVGILGGYTTFSSFSYETIALVDGGRWVAAAAYVAATMLSGLLACAAGVLIARSLGG